MQRQQLLPFVSVTLSFLVIPILNPVSFKVGSASYSAPSELRSIEVNQAFSTASPIPEEMLSTHVTGANFRGFTVATYVRQLKLSLAC